MMHINEAAAIGVQFRDALDLIAPNCSLGQALDALLAQTQPTVQTELVAQPPVQTELVPPPPSINFPDFKTFQKAIAGVAQRLGSAAPIRELLPAYGVTKMSELNSAQWDGFYNQAFEKCQD